MAASKYSSSSPRLGLVALAVLGVMSSASAIADDAPGWYLGGNVGRTRNHFDNGNIVNSLAGQGFRVNSNTGDEHDTGYKIFGGYQINRNFAVEGGYFDLGRLRYTFNTVPSGSFNGDSRVRGLNLDLVGILPVWDRFSVFGRVGANYARTRSSFSGTSNIALNNFSTRNNETNIKGGLGLQYAITPALSVRGELERYRISDPIRNRGHIDMASIGLVYRFGGKMQEPVAQTSFVPVVTPPPPPAPVVVAPPPPPPPAAVAPAPVYVPPARPTRQDRN